MYSYIMGRDPEGWQWLFTEGRLFQVGLDELCFALVCKSHWTNQFCCILKPVRRIPRCCVQQDGLFCCPHVILCWKMLHRRYPNFLNFFFLFNLNFSHRSVSCHSLFVLFSGWMCKSPELSGFTRYKFICFYTLQKILIITKSLAENTCGYLKIWYK